jgi:hypothetical protein
VEQKVFASVSAVSEVELRGNHEYFAGSLQEVSGVRAAWFTTDRAL